MALSSLDVILSSGAWDLGLAWKWLTTFLYRVLTTGALYIPIATCFLAATWLCFLKLTTLFVVSWSTVFSFSLLGLYWLSCRACYISLDCSKYWLDRNRLSWPSACYELRILDPDYSIGLKKRLVELAFKFCLSLSTLIGVFDIFGLFYSCKLELNVLLKLSWFKWWTIWGLCPCFRCIEFFIEGFDSWLGWVVYAYGDFSVIDLLREMSYSSLIVKSLFLLLSIALY